MSALDYTFGPGGVLLRLRGQLRAGWNDRGPRGPFFRGVCTFVWKEGVSCRAEVSLYPRGRAEGMLAELESLEWRRDDEGCGVSWLLRGGEISVEVPFYVGSEAAASLNPCIGFQEPASARLHHSEHGGSGGFGGPAWKVDLKIVMAFDPRRSKPVEWEKGSGMASAGLPTLGKRR